jgi:hypothetical protein
VEVHAEVLTRPLVHTATALVYEWSIHGLSALVQFFSEVSFMSCSRPSLADGPGPKQEPDADTGRKRQWSGQADSVYREKRGHGRDELPMRIRALSWRASNPLGPR